MMQKPTTKPQPPASWRIRMLMERLRSEADASLGPRKTRSMIGIMRELMIRLPDHDLMGLDRAAVQHAAKEMMDAGRTRDDIALLQRGLNAIFDLGRNLKLIEGHPLREGGRAYTGQPTDLLLVGVKPDHATAIRQSLRLLSSTSVDREDNMARALEAVRWYPYSRIVTGFPLASPGIEKLLGEVRHKSSPTRRAGLVIVAPESEAERMNKLKGRGCNHVVTEESAGDLAAVFSGLDNVEPRAPLKVPLLISDSGIGTDVMALWQTENISNSGVLVRTRARAEVGLHFGGELRLPGDNRPLKVRAEIVRTTIEQREHMEGVGARFTLFEDDSQDRLATFMASQAS